MLNIKVSIYSLISGHLPQLNHCTLCKWNNQGVNPYFLPLWNYYFLYYYFIIITITFPLPLPVCYAAGRMTHPLPTLNNEAPPPHILQPLPSTLHYARRKSTWVQDYFLKVFKRNLMTLATLTDSIAAGKVGSPLLYQLPREDEFVQRRGHMKLNEVESQKRISFSQPIHQCCHVAMFSVHAGLCPLWKQIFR